MLLTVEYNNKGVVELHLDKQGLDFLVTTLAKLREHGGHDHLMTPAWAGTELTEERKGEANELINHLYLRLWPDD